MPGPPPKDASVRARRNKSATKATLRVAGPDDDPVEVPELPTLHREVDGQMVETPWHPMALDFWDEVWTSPMAPQYLDADVPGLVILATLTHSYWLGVAQGRMSKDLAGEIRLQRVDYGLTPIARRRLQWEIERAEDAADKGARRRRTKQPEPDAPEGEGPVDPRLTLVS